MPQRRVVLLTVVAVTVLALGLAAPSMPTLPNDERPASGATGHEEGPVSPIPDLPPWMIPVFFALLAVTALISVVLIALDKQISPFVVIVVIGILSVLLLFVAEFVDFGPLPEQTREILNASYGPAGEQAGGSATGESAGGSQGIQPAPTGTLALLGMAIVVGGVVVYRVTRTQDTETTATSKPEQDATTAVSHAAGRAADRIENTSLQNAVYEAWHEMTTILDVTDPETTTPGEFSDAAVAAGVDPADAERLTDLFREIRYGETTVTPGREREARETFRRIEAAYADQTEGPHS